MPLLTNSIILFIYLFCLLLFENVQNNKKNAKISDASQPNNVIAAKLKYCVNAKVWI
jgi:hypothetical protein